MIPDDCKPPCIPLVRLEEKLVAERQMRDARLHALETATERAREEMERRLEGMNEFRDALKDQAGRFVTRDELQAMIRPILVDVQELSRKQATTEGKASQGAVNVSLAVALIGVAAGVVGILLRVIS